MSQQTPRYQISHSADPTDASKHHGVARGSAMDVVGCIGGTVG